MISCFLFIIDFSYSILGTLNFNLNLNHSKLQKVKLNVIVSLYNRFDLIAQRNYKFSHFPLSALEPWTNEQQQKKISSKNTLDHIHISVRHWWTFNMKHILKLNENWADNANLVLAENWVNNNEHVRFGKTKNKEKCAVVIYLLIH